MRKAILEPQHNRYLGECRRLYVSPPAMSVTALVVKRVPLPDQILFKHDQDVTFYCQKLLFVALSDMLKYSLTIKEANYCCISAGSVKSTQVQKGSKHHTVP